MEVRNSLTNKKSAPISVYMTNDAVKRQINSILGGKNGMRFTSSIVSAVQATPALQECSNASIVNAALLGESLNLSPSPQLGHFYMVPFNNKQTGIKTATFVIGYKGLIQLATRSGYYKKINVIPIKDGELIRYDPMDEEIEVNLIEDEEQREEAPTIGYYAMFQYTNGFKKSLYWSKKRMLTHADKYSAAFSKSAYEKLLKGLIPEKDKWKFSSYWYSDFDGMACKTMLRQLIGKWGIMSIDLQDAFEKDGAIIHEDLSADYVDTADEVPTVTNVQESIPDSSQTPQEDIHKAVTYENTGSIDGQISLEDSFFANAN